MTKHFCRALCGLAVLLAFTGGIGINAQAGKTNLGEMRKEIELFESVLNQSLRQAFGGPFGILDAAHGAYLPGYGVVISFELNLSPVRNMGPFSSVPSAQDEAPLREEEARRREKAKELADQLLGNFGQTLSQLAPDESVAVIIHTAAAHSNGVVRSTIVISAPKKLIEERQRNMISQTQFTQRLTTTEY